MRNRVCCIAANFIIRFMNRPHVYADRLLVFASITSMFVAVVKSDHSASLLVFALVVWRWRKSTQIDVRMFVVPLVVVSLVMDLLWLVLNKHHWTGSDSPLVDTVSGVYFYYLLLALAVLKVVFRVIRWRPVYAS